MTTPVTIRPAEPTPEDGLRFARYLDAAAAGMFGWMLGRRADEIVAAAFLEGGHDLSYEYAHFAELDGEVVGMVSGYSAEQHAVSDSGPLTRAAGPGLIRLGLAWLVASPVLRFIDRVPDGDWYLQAVAVDADRRGAGIGSALLEHAASIARRSGASRIVLDVGVANDGARRLYERWGMKIETTSKSATMGPRRAVHRMVRTLDEPHDPGG